MCAWINNKEIVRRYKFNVKTSLDVGQLELKYRNISSLDWKVSALGFGCMRLPARRINKLRAKTDESIEIIRYGIDLGINYVDTAWPYHLGDSEKIIGYALKDGYRERVHLVTKLPMLMVRNSKHFDKYLNSQMKRLQTDYLDGYLFHALNAGQFRNQGSVKSSSDFLAVKIRRMSVSRTNITKLKSTLPSNVSQ